MGLRGPGARARLQVIEGAKGKKRRRLPWERSGLSRVERVKKFLEFLPITKGTNVGKRMRLLPEQLRYVEDVYGPTGSGGRRMIRLAIQSEPKGNGKTGLASGLCLCHLLGPEAEPRGEVYSAAIDRGQAALIYAECEAIVLAVPEFAERVNLTRFQKKIEVLSGVGVGSVYEALSSDARRAHGLAPSLFIYDELAQTRDRTLLDNLLQGLGKRDEALGMIISTQAPDDDHPLSQLIDDGLSGADPTTYVQLISAPMDADPFARETWLRCNPALGRFLSMDEMESAAARAQRLPMYEPSFRNLRLNQRVESDVEARIVPLTTWQALGIEPRPIDEQIGRKCWGALDLSGKHDLTVITLLFPDDPDDPETVYDVYAWFWSPEGQLDARRPAERDLFKTWAREGLLELVPGNVIRFRYVAEKLAQLVDDFDVVSIGFDRWRIDDLKAELGDVDGVDDVDELPLEPYGQGFQDMGPAVDALSELCLTGRLRHGGHPILTASMSAAVTVSDPADNKKIDKRRGNRTGAVRVDGAVTLAIASRLATRNSEEDDASSVYDQPGFVI